MNALGDFLRARRELVSPKDAGISADYYLRLEQGRDRNPSVQVLEALARVLRLTEAATAHLLTLGDHLPPRADLEQALDSIVELIDSWPTTAAYVQNRFTDVLAVNEFGRTSHLRHPQVGDLQLRSDKLMISGTAGLMLVTFHAPPGTPDAERLATLTLEPQAT